MPTICIDCRYANQRPSGIGELVENLAEHAPRLEPDLDFVLLRHPQRIAPLSDAPNVHEIIVSSPANGPGTMWLLPRIVDLSGIDLFHAPANILPAGLRMKTLTTVHDLMWLTHPDWCRTGLYGRIERAFYGHGMRRALKYSDRIATVSQASLDAIAQYDRDAARKARVTLSGVSPQFAPAERDERFLAAMGLGEALRYVLIVGQNAPYKNHAGALRAFAEAFGDDETTHLVLVQRRQAGRNTLGNLARELGIAARTHFLQTLERDQLVQLYSSAAALLHPSLCEGFGNPIAEAMACGCPVITSDLSAMPQVAAGAARLVDPHDTSDIAAALREVVDDSELAKAMRTKGLARAKKLSWQRFAADNIALYREILATS